MDAPSIVKLGRLSRLLSWASPEVVRIAEFDETDRVRTFDGAGDFGPEHHAVDPRHGPAPKPVLLRRYGVSLAAHAMPMQGEWIDLAHVFVTALIGIMLLSASVQGCFFGNLGLVLRGILLAAALAMIQGGWILDVIGLGVGLAVFAYQKRFVTHRTFARGAD